MLPKNRKRIKVLISVLIVIVNVNLLYATITTSAITGDFSATSTWVGGIVPSVTDTVVIANGDTVRFTGDVTLRYLIISAGGVLDNEGFVLNITESGSSGTLFTIDGEYTGSGTTNFYVYSSTPSSNHINGSGTISASTGGCWLFSGAALSTAQIDTTANLTFDISGCYFSTGGSTTKVEVYCYGTITFVTGDLNVGGTLWAGGSGRLTIGSTGVVNLTVGNLNMSGNSTILNNGIVTVGGSVLTGSSTTYWYNNTGSTVNIAGDFLRVNGSATAYARLTANYLDNIVNYNGTVNQKIIKPYLASIYRDLQCSNSGTKTLDANITVFGDLTIRDAAQLDVSATPYNITLRGNWIDSSTHADPFIEQSGTVTFGGTAAQTITASPLAEGETFYNLTINNTSATGVTLGNPAIVSNSLTLTDGIIFTDASNILTLNDNATSGTGSDTVFVDGPMKKIGNDAFVFPLGDGMVWARLGISAPSNATTEYTAQYINAVYGDGDVAGDLSTNGSIHHVSGLEYWTLAQSVNDDDVKITLYWEDASVNKITDCSELSIGHFTGSTWVEEAATTVGGSTCSGTGNGSITTNAVVANYSPFTFASKYGWTNNPLPVELLSFTAVPKGNSVELQWITATETNNDYFTVEKTSPDLSKGGELTFVPIGTVKGAGNSSAPLNYHLLDESPSPSERAGVRYYRLKQTDYDGRYSYSSIISIYLQNPLSTTIYPNPAADNLNVIVPGEKDETVSLSVIDKLGRTIIYKEENLEGSSSINLNVSSLSAGVYLLQIKTASGLKEQKPLMIR